jgi:hypothetical protein
MHDRRESYNRPLNKKRSEIDSLVVESEKEEEGPTRAPVKAGLLSQGQKGQSYEGWVWGP